MTKKERSEKEKICDDFLKNIESQFQKFTEQTGIHFANASFIELDNFKRDPFEIGPRLVKAFRQYEFWFAPYVHNTPTPDNMNNCYYIFTDELDHPDFPILEE